MRRAGIDRRTAALCVALVVAGTSLALFPMGLPGWLVLLGPALVALFVCLGSKKARLVGAAACGALALIGALALRRAGIPLTALGEHGLYLALGSGLTAALWMLVRVTAMAWPVAVAGLGMLAVPLALGVRGNGAALGLVMAGLIPLFAAAFAAKLGGKRGETPAAPTAQAALAAVPVALLCLMATLLLPAQTTPWPAFVGLADRVGNAVSDNLGALARQREGPPAPDLAPEYTARLGGPITPDTRTVLQLETKTPYLLKASVFDKYTGSGWERTFLGTSAFPDSLKEPSRWAAPLDTVSDASRAHTLGAFSALPPGHPLEPYVSQTAGTVTLLRPREARLFYFGSLTSLSAGEDIVPYMEWQSELMASRPPERGAAYTFEAFTLDRKLEGFDAAMREAMAQPMAVAVLDSTERAAFLQIPSTMVAQDAFLPLRYLAQAVAQVDTVHDPYQQALLLEDWLKSSFTYTLSPEPPPRGQDFVAHFLESGEGYCVYYASAMAMMARMVDIPSRYVTGYAVEPAAGVYAATGATAHAWVELYFDGVGWLAFDPTGRYAAESPSFYDSSMQDRETFAGASTVPAPHWGWLWGLLAAPVVLALALALILGVSRRTFSLPRLRAQGMAAEVILSRYRADLARQIALLGWHRETGETEIAFAARMGGYLPEQADNLEAVAAAACARHYGGRAPGEADIAAAAKLHGELDALVAIRLGVGRYYAYRLRRLWRMK